MATRTQAKRVSKAAPKKGARKTAVKVAAKLERYSKGEHIIVAPLHHTKPTVALEDLGKARKSPSDHDLFDGQTVGAPANAHLSYFGGPLLTNVQVVTVFWGKLWGTPSGVTTVNNINAFFKAILVSPLIDQLHEYSVPGKVIGHGALAGSKVITVNAPVVSVTDTTVRAQLKAWITGGKVPKPTPNTLYFVYLDPGIVSIMGGSKSCSSFCGYHNTISGLYYAVMPYPNCAGCLGGLSAFNALTGTSSHELCEAITDPVPGRGWYDSNNGEIGDICAWSFKNVAGFTVQKEWSNQQNACV
jgi:hypothetical protein